MASSEGVDLKNLPAISTLPGVPGLVMIALLAGKAI